MSSLSATQADSYYVPPSYFTSGQYKKKSRNEFAGSKGHNQYLKNGTVRFELPYDGFCDKCGTQVGKGTRFNAKKTKAGAYLTSPIYEFRTKCRICSDSEFVIRTNPKKQSFDYVSGIHMRAYELDFIEEENKKKVVHPKSAQRKAFYHRLRQLPGDRREKKSRLKGAASLGWKEGMELLSEEREEDIVKAKSTIFSNGKKKEVSNFRKLRTSSIFSSKGKRKSTIEKSSTPEVVTSISTPDEVTSLGNTASSCEVQSTDSRSTQSNARILNKERKILVLQHSRKGGKISVDTVPSSFMFAALSGYGSDSE